MAIALTLEELLGPSLRDAREEIQATFKTPEELRSHGQEALNLPKVQEFRLSFEDYIARSEKLAEQLAGDNGIIIRSFLNSSGGTSSEIRHAWQVYAVCHNHVVPKIVAIASITTEETGGLTEQQMQEVLQHRRFTHADLTHSYHSERINEHGRIICREHGTPAVLEVSAKMHRVVPKPKLSQRKIEGRIIENIAAIFYSNGNGRSSEKHERILEEVRSNLEVLLRAGEDGIYNTIYEALEQTRHRAVTTPHIAKNADLNVLSSRFKGLIGYDAEARNLTPEQLAQQLRAMPLFEVIKELTARYIPSPLVVTVQRTKGPSLVDKVTVAEHYQQLLEAFRKGELQAHLKRLEMPVPDEMKETPPNLDDIVGLQALVHGDKLDYDPSDFRTGTPKLSPEEIEEVRAKCYHVLAVVADIPHGMMGYERMQATRSANGNGNGNAQSNGHRAKQRMPPDQRRPKFRNLNPVRPNGLIVDLTPSSGGRFNDYVVAPKDTGYMAIHTVVGSTDAGLEGAVVEVQIKPNVIDTFERLSARESHEAHKLERAVQINYLLASGLVSRMEWEVNQLLLTPPGRTYKETVLTEANGNSRNAAYLRRTAAQVAAVAAAK